MPDTLSILTPGVDDNCFLAFWVASDGSLFHALSSHPAGEDLELVTAFDQDAGYAMGYDPLGLAQGAYAALAATSSHLQARSDLVDAGSRDFWNSGATAAGTTGGGYSPLDNPTPAQDPADPAVAYDDTPEDLLDIGYHYVGALRHQQEGFRGDTVFGYRYWESQEEMIPDVATAVNPSVYRTRSLDIASGHHNASLANGETAAVAPSQVWSYAAWPTDAPAAVTVPDPVPTSAREISTLTNAVEGDLTVQGVTFLYHLLGGDRQGTQIHGEIGTIATEQLRGFNLSPYPEFTVTAACSVPQRAGYANAGRIYAAVAVLYDSSKAQAGNFSNIFVYRYDGAVNTNYDDDWRLIGERHGAWRTFGEDPDFESDTDLWRNVESLALCAGDAGPYVFWTEYESGDGTSGTSTLRGFFVPDDGGTGFTRFNPAAGTSDPGLQIAPGVPRSFLTGLDSAFDVFQDPLGDVAGQPRIVYTDYHRDSNYVPDTDFFVIASTPVELEDTGTDAWRIFNSTDPDDIREDREEIKEDPLQGVDDQTAFARNPGIAVNDVSGGDPYIQRAFATFSFRDDATYESADRALQDEALTLNDNDTWIMPLAVPTVLDPAGTVGEEYLDVTYRFSGRPRFLKYQIVPGGNVLTTNSEVVSGGLSDTSHYPRIATNAVNEQDVYAVVAENPLGGNDPITLFQIDP